MANMASVKKNGDSRGLTWAHQFAKLIALTRISFLIRLPLAYVTLLTDELS